MSIIEEVGPIGVRPAAQRPVRALALLGLSRLILGMVVTGIAWASWIVGVQPSGETTEVRALVILEPDSATPSGTSVASVLSHVRTGVERQAGTLVDLDLSRRTGGDASVRLTVDLPGTSVASADRLISTLGASHLADLMPRAVDPVPSGLRVSLDAVVELASAEPGGTTPDGRAPAVALAEVAERAGVQLRGVDVPAIDRDVVRIAASGRISDLVDLVDRIERHHSAPMRIRSLSVRRVGDGVHEAVLMFELREDVPWTGTEGIR